MLMELKRYAGSELEAFLSEPGFRIIPQLFLLRMMLDAFRHISFFAIGVATSVFVFRLV